MPNLVKEIPDDTFGSIYAVDYGRLTTLLWGTCRNLLSRVEQLETALRRQNILRKNTREKALKRNLQKKQDE